MRTWSEPSLPRCQIELISPCLDERIGKHAGVRFLDCLLSQVDWSTWEQAYPLGGPGRPPHHPRLMCAGILYGLIRGMHSTRMLEYATEYCVDFQWLLDGRVIDHSTFAKFRTIHGDRIKDLFKAINRKAADLKMKSKRPKKAKRPTMFVFVCRSRIRMRIFWKTKKGDMPRTTRR